MAIELSRGVKISSFQVEVPDCGRDDLPAFLKEQGFKVGAEIGVYRGGFSEKLCQAGLKMFSIDSWTCYAGQVRRSQRFMDAIHRESIKRLSPYDCTIINKFSMDAVEDFDDGSLDFVYIDGSHEFRYFAEDIWEWSKKVRTGGIISGHDYIKNKNNRCHVVHITDAYATAFKAKLFILGRKEIVEGVVRDRIRSWMMFKTWK